MVVDRIETWARGGRDETFEALVAEAYQWQLESSAPLRRLADSEGVLETDDWRRIPMVPTLAFKTQKLGIGSPVEVFHSSGTTDSQPSVHRHPYPDLYRAVIDETFPGACLSGLDRPPMLSLIPERELAPRSSLAFMVDHALARWGGDGSRSVVGTSGVRAADARGFLAARQRDGRPTLVLATTVSLLQLLDGLERLGVAFRLPPGSRLFETGGAKASRTAVDRNKLSASLSNRLGLGHTDIVREYGMTELTSHFYAGDGEPYRPPPWVRARVLDPVTLTERPAGETGLLAIFDLANVGSALHLLTEDLAHADDGGFRLVGRAEGAELRGCSLLSESLAG